VRISFKNSFKIKGKYKMIKKDRILKLECIYFNFKTLVKLNVFPNYTGDINV
jgi:hypothetical protein